MRKIEMPSGAIREVPEKGTYTKAERAGIARVRKVYPGMAISRAAAIARQGLNITDQAITRGANDRKAKSTND